MSTTRLARSIREFGEQEWDAAAGAELMMCHRWHRVMEASRPNYRPRYALVEDRRGPLAAAVSAASSPVTAPGGWAERIAAALTLTFGAPFSARATGIAVRADTSLSAALPAVEPALAELCRLERRVLLGVTNVHEAQLPTFRDRGFVAARRPATMVLDLESSSYDDYLRRLSKSDRAEVRRARRRGEEHRLGLKTAPVDEASRALYPLFVEVCAHHGIPPRSVPITDELFRALAREMPDETHIICGTIADQPAGFVVCFLHGDTLLAPLIGLRYELSRPSCLYQVLMDEVVRWGLQHGVRRIHLGLSNERQKRRHGFLPQSRWACIRAQLQPLNFVLQLLERNTGVYPRN